MKMKFFEIKFSKDETSWALTTQNKCYKYLA